MKTFCRKVFPGVLALLLTFTLIVPASAAEYSFSDVPVDSPWYESVAYIAELGITIGTGEGQYSPDAPITTRQWAVMLCRAYERTDVLAGDSGNFGSACLAEAYRCGWLSDYLHYASVWPDARSALFDSHVEPVVQLSEQDYQRSCSIFNDMYEIFTQKGEDRQEIGRAHVRTPVT